MKYTVVVEGDGFVFAWKRAKKTDDLNKIKAQMRSDPFGASDYAVQGPGMEANIVITDESGEEIMNDILDSCNFNSDVLESEVPQDLASDEVLITYAKPVRGRYVNETFEAPGELDETGTCTTGEEEVGIGGDYISGLPGDAYVFTKMGFSEHRFTVLRPASTSGAYLRIWTSDGEPYFLSEDSRQRFYPMDERLEDLIEANQDALYPDEDEEADTSDVEEEIMALIGDLDLDDLDEVEDSYADGLYIDPEETSNYSLVKDGRILLAFDAVE